MSLPIPIVGVETGPLYASDLNNSLLIVDAHNHSSGSGVQINPAGLNINTDLTFSGNNATNLRSIRLTPSTVADPADIGCVFENNVGDLWYNNSIGQQVQITSGNAVAVSGAIGFSGLPSGTASAAYIAGSGTFQFQQATSVGANLDVASIAIRYPGSYPTPAGDFIQLQAPNTLASGYSITLPALPAANNTFMTMSTAGVIGTLLTIDNSTLAISGNSIIVKPQGITTSQLADGSVTPVKKSALGEQLSSSSSNPTTTSAIYADITNQIVTIVTTGRPVLILMQPDGSVNNSFLNSFVTAGTGQGVNVQLMRDGSRICGWQFEIDSPSSGVNKIVVPPSLVFLDNGAIAASHVYKFQYRVVTATNGSSFQVGFVKTVAYEL